MTRKLPWKKAETSLTSIPRSPGLTPIGRQKKREVSEDDDNQAAASPAPAKRVKSSHSVPASPAPKPVAQSASSPPSPKPLPESYMIEGLENDDLYRMVEDEFLSTAQQFTAHLHAAEYQRLKAASKSQNADTIRDISRPVVGRMTDLVKLKQERKARLEKQRAATRKARAERGLDDEPAASESDLWHTASLHGLMESPRKKATRLDNLTKVATTTRAAAGFSMGGPRQLFTTSNPSRKDLTSSRPIPNPTRTHDVETESDDEDDLDRSHAKTPTNPILKPTPSVSRPPQPRPIPSNASVSNPLRRTEHVHPIIRQSEPKANTTIEASSSDEAGSGDFLSRLKQRQEDRKRNREQRKLVASSKAHLKTSTATTATTDDIIPGFL